MPRCECAPLSRVGRSEPGPADSVLFEMRVNGKMKIPRVAASCHASKRNHDSSHSLPVEQRSVDLLLERLPPPRRYESRQNLHQERQNESSQITVFKKRDGEVMPRGNPQQRDIPVKYFNEGTFETTNSFERYRPAQ